MKAKEFNKVDDLLITVNKLLKEVETCDTSFQHPDWESEQDIKDWNERLTRFKVQIEVLRMEMIFTFKIELEK